MSVAELVLTRYLLGAGPTEDDVEGAYARAVLEGEPRPDEAWSVLDQVRLYRQVGDDEQLLDRIEARVRPSLASGGSPG